MASALAGLSACATRDRAEAVYLYQNRITAALAEAVQAVEAEGGDEVEALYEAEAALQRDCGPLQRAGYRRFNQEELDTAERLAAFESLDACEARAAKVEALIREVDPETAAYFLAE
ncbi:MAG: hypothetical protein QNJ30_10590 [Kiloniellales bacterium]|nr:hypothetical protein [Kiloniellales bacterium]